MNILNQEIILEFFRAYYLLFVVSLFLGTFLVTYFIIPKVIWISNEKRLMAPVNERSSHAVETPSFGGVAFYVTLILVFAIIQSMRLTYVGNHLIAAMTILFMVGLKDDLVVSTAKVKLIGQVLATGFIIFSTELQLTSLQGFMGIYEIPEILGYALKAFIVIALINAYNLIDGIDGLAAMMGIVISAVYAYIFYSTGNPYYVLVSVSVTGTLIAFLRYNFSRRKKIFMGDSGSLIIGLILGALSLKILVMEPYALYISRGYNTSDRLLLIACVLFIPVFDTLRVMLIRMIRGVSPFSADKNHAHHVLLNLGYSHAKASACLAIVNLLVIVTYWIFANLLSHPWLTFLVVLMYGTAFLILHKLRLIGEERAKGTHTGPTAPRERPKGINVQGLTFREEKEKSENFLAKASEK